MIASICILGFGYSAKFIAEKLSAQHFDISGTSRDLITREDSARQGYQIVDFDSVSVSPLLQKATHVLISTPPTGVVGDPVLNHLLPVLEKYCHRWQWLGYLSSTSVYGDHQGAWVDETSSPLNLGARASLRRECEVAWQQFAEKYKLPLHIFRLAAIYGPQRNALHEIINGKTHSIYKPGQYFSRIHVEDIANIILASIQMPNPGTLYNVADDLPTHAHEVDQYAAQLLKRSYLPLVPFDQASLSPMAAEFYSSNRRVCNTRIKTEFKITLDYTSYREGLMQLYQSGDYRW